MGKKGSKGKKAGALSKGAQGKRRMPKSTCCESRPKCGRCPLRMLKEGTLPPGYTVKRRRLVKTGLAA